MSKPKGMLETNHLIQLQEEKIQPIWGLMGDLYGFTPDRSYFDEITGEIFCYFLGSLMDIDKK